MHFKDLTSYNYNEQLHELYLNIKIQHVDALIIMFQ